MDTRKRIEEAGRLSLAANKRFTSENRELLASFEQDSLWKAVLAFIQLESRSEIEQGDPSVEFYLSIIRRAFLTLLDEGSIEPIFPITTLGQQALDAMRRATGLGIDTLPAPIVELTPAEKLDQEIIHDWQTLSGDQLRKKRDSSRAYRDALARLLETDKLSPHASLKVTY